MAAPNRFPFPLDQLIKDFSPTEHFQDQVKRLVNPEVARYFRDTSKISERKLLTQRNRLRMKTITQICQDRLARQHRKIMCRKQ